MNPLACNEPLNFHFSIRTPVIKQLIILENAVVGKGLRYKRIERKDFPIVKNHEAWLRLTFILYVSYLPAHWERIAYTCIY